MICTTIEQSEKLVKLGLDRKTADMYYWCGGGLRIGGYLAQDEDFDVPAWSLSALLELMPTLDGRNPKLNRLINTNKWWIMYHSTANYPLIRTKECNSPLEAAFDMVCRLLENKKLYGL